MVGIAVGKDFRYYTYVLHNCLNSNAGTLLSVNWDFQYENTSVYTFIYSNNVSGAIDVDFIDWPAKSPDLNIIENARRYILRKV